MFGSTAHPRDCAGIGFGDQRSRDGVRSEQVLREFVAREHHRVGFALVVGQLPHEREDLVEIGGRRVADGHFLTKGRDTMRASSTWPRTSICTSSPGCRSGGTNASAMPCPSIGEKFPLVTAPIS